VRWKEIYYIGILNVFQTPATTYFYLENIGDKIAESFLQWCFEFSITESIYSVNQNRLAIFSRYTYCIFGWIETVLYILAVIFLDLKYIQRFHLHEHMGRTWLFKWWSLIRITIQMIYVIYCTKLTIEIIFRI